jgi:hypothetical protein
MEISTDRPRTPPPAGLLTPPSTGGVDKRLWFYDPTNGAGFSTTIPRRLANPREGESPTEFFNDNQEGSDPEIHDESEAEHHSSSDSSSPTSPSLSEPCTFASSVLIKYDFAVALNIAGHASSIIKGPFPFIKLPLSIRTKVYEHLLVIPALICVRQNHTTFHDDSTPFLHAERRVLLPGIAHASPQLTVSGPKIPFSRFAHTNTNILYANKEIHTEAKAILYGNNTFAIAKPTNELSPPPDFSVRLFPPGCQRLVTKLNMRIHSFYDLHWLLSGGYNVLKNHYRGLDTLTLVLELQSTTKGLGKQWAKQQGEKWVAYVEQLHNDIGRELVDCAQANKARFIPQWIHLVVLFSGERYIEDRDSPCSASGVGPEQAAREHVKQGLVEAWDLFKKGAR